MTILEDIMQQLTDMGITAPSYMELGNLQPGTISTALQDYYGLSEQDIPAHMFQGFSSNILGAGLGKTYSPQIQATGQSMLGKLQESLGGQKATQAAGGFAGSGAFGKMQSQVRDVYGKSMSDVITQSRGQQQQAGNLISDLIGGWHETAQRIKGY